jgi:hypothetical protein
LEIRYIDHLWEEGIGMMDRLNNHCFIGENSASSLPCRSLYVAQSWMLGEQKIIGINDTQSQNRAVSLNCEN